MTQSWFDAGQSRESGGRRSESTDFAAGRTDYDPPDPT